MEDNSIIDLYFARDENAISETQAKYGRLIFSVAYNVLLSKEDAEESVNDTYLAVWNAIPPAKPTFFSSFICKISRRIAINKLKFKKSQKRGGDAVVLELLDVLPDEELPIESDSEQIGKILNRFLAGLDEEKRIIFVKHYYFSEPLEDISKEMFISVGKIKSILFRLREKLKNHLESEEIL